jgi:hypothetical protein
MVKVKYISPYNIKGETTPKNYTHRCKAIGSNLFILDSPKTEIATPAFCGLASMGIGF